MGGGGLLLWRLAILIHPWNQSSTKKGFSSLQEKKSWEGLCNKHQVQRNMINLDTVQILTFCGILIFVLGVLYFTYAKFL